MVAKKVCVYIYIYICIICMQTYIHTYMCLLFGKIDRELER